MGTLDEHAMEGTRLEAPEATMTRKTRKPHATAETESNASPSEEPSPRAPEDKMLSIPKDAGRLLVESAGMMSCPLHGTDNFVRFCKGRDINVDRERLIRLERLEMFAPIFRVREPDEKNAEPFLIPVQPDNNWFKKGWAWDTTGGSSGHLVPDAADGSQEAYYSIFQIRDLELTLSALSCDVHLDSYLESDLQPNGQQMLEHTKAIVKSLRPIQHQTAVALLCQFISNRYYTKTQSDKRVVRAGGHSSSDKWTTVHAFNFDWDAERRQWDATKIAALFGLTPEKLKRAYETMAIALSSDPLDAWYELVQFVRLDERRRLKGAALRAETVREAAQMLRWLYEDLYSKKLPEPHEVYRTVITAMPEHGVRSDVRKHLEFVSNRFGVNPQAKAVLFVEGQSEEFLIAKLLDEGFGIHYGTAFIEIVNLNGVGNATGNKKRDRFQAIFRLVDYLHHHQTLCFLILDNENGAKHLKESARTAPSMFSVRKHAIPYENIHLWAISLEFDCLDDQELADALSRASGGRATFGADMIATCRHGRNPGSALTKLFAKHCGVDLPKLALASEIATKLLRTSPDSIDSHPLIALLHKILEAAVRNPLPTMQEIWEENQKSDVFRHAKASP